MHTIIVALLVFIAHCSLLLMKRLCLKHLLALAAAALARRMMSTCYGVMVATGNEMGIEEEKTLLRAYAKTEIFRDVKFFSQRT